MELLLSILSALFFTATLIPLCATSTILDQGNLYISPKPQCQGGSSAYSVEDEGCLNITEPFVSFQATIVSDCWVGQWLLYHQPDCHGFFAVNTTINLGTLPGNRYPCFDLVDVEVPPPRHGGGGGYKYGGYEEGEKYNGDEALSKNKPKPKHPPIKIRSFYFSCVVDNPPDDS